MSNNTIIPAEIKGDAFYNNLVQCASFPFVKNILEIGSSSGQGSTEAFVHAIRNRPDGKEVRLFCMEVSEARFKNLAANYTQDTFVKPYHRSSVRINQFPSSLDVARFYESIPTSLNRNPLEVVLSWLHQDIECIRTYGLNECGIDLIKKENSIDFFDLVLIDGSEFTGEVECKLIMGAKIIALDDINSFKCYHAHHLLLNNPDYSLVVQDLNCRNGFSIFQRIN